MSEVRKRPQYMELSAHPSAVSCARDHVRRVLAAWGRTDLVEVAELLVSELVANAVKARHGSALWRGGIHLARYAPCS